MMAGITNVAAAGWTGTLRIAQGMAHRAMEGALVLVVGVLSWHAFWWAFTYATAALVAKQDAVGTAAVLAAILGPLATLQGFVLAKYMTSRNGNGSTEVK